MKYPDEKENFDPALGGRGAIMGIKGLVLQDLIRIMDDRMGKRIRGRKGDPGQESRDEK